MPLLRRHRIQRSSNRAAVMAAPPVPPAFRFIEPCQPTLRLLPPTRPRWTHEVKFDGWRLQIHKVGHRCRLYTRRGHDVSASFPTIATAALALSARSLICDAELVATNAQGLPDFGALHRLRGQAPLCVWLF